MIWRYLPLAGMVLVVAIALCVRPLLQFRRHGTFGVFLFRTRSLEHNARDLLLVVLFVGLITQAVVAARRFKPPPYSLISHGTAYDVLQVAGAVLMLGGVALFAMAGFHLGASWRIGIVEGAKPGLVTDGLYRFSRNPIYLGLLMALAGYAALLPTLLSVILLICAFLFVRAQTSAEEAYLERTYGEAYRDYARRVGRFLPGLGKR